MQVAQGELMNGAVYLDNNATTRVDPAVVVAMLPFFTERYGKFLVRARTTATANTTFLGILWPASNVAPFGMSAHASRAVAKTLFMGRQG